MSIGNNIKWLRESRNLTQAEFGKIAGVSDKAVSTWENGTAEPRMGAIQKIADYFGVSKGWIIDNDLSDDPHQTYYLDPAAAQLAQELFERPEMRVLFDASRNASKEDIEQVASILEKMSGGASDD